MLSTLRQGRLDPISTANFPILRTGSTARNVVCDFASFQGEARSRDVKRLEDYVAYFETHCQKVAAANGAGLKLSKVGNFRPFLVPLDDPILAIGRNRLPRPEHQVPGRDRRRRNGRQHLQCAGHYLRGRGHRLHENHTHSEQLVLEDFFLSGRLAAALIETYAQGCESK